MYSGDLQKGIERGQKVKTNSWICYKLLTDQCRPSLSSEELQKDLIESINTAVYCDSKCANKDCVKNICKLNILNKSIILNIVSVEFDE